MFDLLIFCFKNIEMEITQNVVGWFEIPVKDMERAMKFYETVLNVKLDRHQMGPFDMAWFPFPKKEAASGAAGSLVYHEELYETSAAGVLVYFSSLSGDLDNELSRVEAAGGKILSPKTLITEDIGYMGMILDTEGNRVAFHSKK